MPLAADKLLIRKMLRNAADFAAKAMGYVVSELGEDAGPPNRVFHDYARLVHSLEVHFLFPNLSEVEREALTRISRLRSMIMAYRKESPDIADQDATVFTGRLNRLSAELAAAQAEVGDETFAANMTPTQRRLLELEYLVPIQPVAHTPGSR